MGSYEAQSENKEVFQGALALCLFRTHLFQGHSIPGCQCVCPSPAFGWHLKAISVPQDDNRYHEDIFGVTLRTYEVTNRLRSESIAFIEESKKDTDE